MNKKVFTPRWVTIRFVTHCNETGRVLYAGDKALMYPGKGFKKSRLYSEFSSVVRAFILKNELIEMND